MSPRNSSAIAFVYTYIHSYFFLLLKKKADDEKEKLKMPIKMSSHLGEEGQTNS